MNGITWLDFCALLVLFVLKNILNYGEQVLGPRSVLEKCCTKSWLSGPRLKTAEVRAVKTEGNIFQVRIDCVLVNNLFISPLRLSIFSRFLKGLAFLRLVCPIELLDIECALCHVTGVQFDRKICPYKSAILWRQLFDWHEIGARILCLLFLWFVRTLKFKTLVIHSECFVS